MHSRGVMKGARVRISLHDPSKWARGAAQALNGLTGTIREIKTLHNAGITSYTITARCLVELDTPPPAWWAGQRPSLSWWFSAEDLQDV